jgi:restriction system protein
VPFVYVPEDALPVLLNQSVITPYQKTDEGELIKAVTIPLLAILKKIWEDPSRMYQIDPRKWEEIIAATYDESGIFDEVTLTPRSGDDGRDVIAVKRGFWSMRVIESVKRYRPGHVVTAGEIRDLLGALHADPQVSKGVVSTTSEFAPRIRETSQIMQYLPDRLELVDCPALVERFKLCTKKASCQEVYPCPAGRGRKKSASASGA